METFELVLPTWAACPLFNSDSTGISEEDDKALTECLRRKVPMWFSRIPVDHTVLGFAATNDLNNLGDEVARYVFPARYDKTKTYDFYNDPGHGWCKVPIAELYALEISDKISRCSYERRQYAYLEEDCDLAVFMEAMLEKKRTKVKFREHYADRGSRIRSYNPYQSRAAAAA